MFNELFYLMIWCFDCCYLNYLAIFSYKPFFSVENINIIVKVLFLNDVLLTGTVFIC